MHLGSSHIAFQLQGEFSGCRVWIDLEKRVVRIANAGFFDAGDGRSLNRRLRIRIADCAGDLAMHIAFGDLWYRDN